MPANSLDRRLLGWRLGETMDLGVWNSPVPESPPELRHIEASADLLSRLVNRGGGDHAVPLMVDEVAWRFASGDRGGPYTCHATVTSRKLLSGGARSFDVLLESRDVEGNAAVRGDCVATTVAGARSDAKAVEEAPFATFVNDAWVAQLGERLGDDDHFSEATSTFDGSMGLHFGRVGLGLRIYRGRVIDSGRAILGDATFSISASSHTWLEFSRRPRNEFIPFAMSDRFTVIGSTYEYLRLTRSLIVVTDHVREMVRSELEES